MNAGETDMITSNNPDSFARFTLEHRLPRIVDEAREVVVARGESTDVIDRLKAELLQLEGFNRFTAVPVPHRDYWNRQIEIQNGKTWISAPFLWVEFYFYWKLQEATGFFQSGTDVFWAKTEWSNLGIHAVEKLEHRAADILGGKADLRDALNWSLLGNSCDLSQLENGQSASVQPVFLIDQRAEILDSISHCNHLIWLADNAGEELANDLIFVASTLREQLDLRVSFHVKPIPMFVSDAREQHVFEMIKCTKECPALKELLSVLTETGRFCLESIIENALPDALPVVCQTADTYVVSKGDLWYRRVFGDRIPEAGADLQQGIASLRWVKSEAGHETHVGGGSLLEFQQRPMLMAIA